MRNYYWYYHRSLELAHNIWYNHDELMNNWIPTSRGSHGTHEHILTGCERDGEIIKLMTISQPASGMNRSWNSWALLDSLRAAWRLWSGYPSHQKSSPLKVLLRITIKAFLHEIHDSVKVVSRSWFRSPLYECKFGSLFYSIFRQYAGRH